MFSSGECVFETTFDTFTFDKPSVFGMFFQMYQAIIRTEAKIDQLLVTRYDRANIVELEENGGVVQQYEKHAIMGVNEGAEKARYNITRAFGVLESKALMTEKNNQCEGILDNEGGELGSKGKTVGVHVGALEPNPKNNKKQPKVRPDEVFSILVDTADIIDSDNPLFYYSSHNKMFRIQSKQLYLTYPQSGDLTREDVIEKVEKEFGSIDQYIICYEVHKNGGRHIHAYIKMEDKVTRKGYPRWLDINGHHPNIESRIRSLSAVIKYVTKGGDYISKGIDVDYLLSPEGRGRNGIRMKVVTEALAGNSLVSIVDKYKSPLYGLTGFSRDIELYKQMKMDIELEHRPLREFSIGGIPFVFEGYHKEKQFWIVGPTNTGKTTIIESFMEQGYIGFELPTDDWWEGWHNKIGYVYGKEYHGGLTLMAMNKFLEGGKGRHKLKIKGGTLWKTINVPVLIESNLYPHEVYHGMPRRRVDALAARLNVIELIPFPDGRKGHVCGRLLSEKAYMQMMDDYYAKDNKKNAATPL